MTPDREMRMDACPVCGAGMVWIRGMYPYPKQPKRQVCATCTYERLEQIRAIVDRDYGLASQGQS